MEVIATFDVHTWLGRAVALCVVIAVGQRYVRARSGVRRSRRHV